MADELRSGLGSRRWAFAGALAVYAVLLMIWRPATPFEWDEVLFLQALDKFDVAQHQPHPPGYPLYVAMGRAVRLVVRDPVAALQLLSVAAAVGTVLAAWVLARRLGASRMEASAGAVLLAATPTFLFHANVGFSDLPGTAVALLAAYLLLRSLDDVRALRLAGAAVAAAIAIRPQLILALVPLGVAALAQAVRRRRWGAMLLATAGGLVVSAACWVPAVLITGPTRFRQALLDATNWITEKEVTGRFPGAPLGALARQWLIFPWAAAFLAVVFWALVVIGAVVWWRRGNRRLVLVAGGSGFFYLLAGMGTMHLAESVRYILPALPFFAILAGGIAATPSPGLRRLGIGAAAAWGLAAIVWIWPTLELRRTHPAPNWDAVEWIAANCDPHLDTVVFDGALKPHVFYLLRPRGFHIEERKSRLAYASFLPRGAVVSLSRDPRKEGTIALDRRWEARGLTALTRGLYNRCVVATAPTATWIGYSPSLSVADKDWLLDGSAEVRLADGMPMQALSIGAGDRALDVSLAGRATIEIAPRGSALVPLRPGLGGQLTLALPTGGSDRIPEPEFVPVSSDDWTWLTSASRERELFVPAVAHVRGRLESLWVTDLLLANPDNRSALSLMLGFSPEVNPPGRAVVRSRTLGPGETVLLTDVVQTMLGTDGRGALRIVAERPFGVLWRTYDRKIPHTLADPAFLRSLTASQAVAGATMSLEFRAGTSGIRSNVGFLNPSGEPVEIRYTMRLSGGSILTGPNLLRLPAHGFDQLDDDELLGRGWRKVSGVVTLEFTASAPVIGFRSLIENDSNRASYLIASRQ